MMNKLIFIILTLLISTLLNAQQKLVLYEEFSGENCDPCAAVNPGLWKLLSANSEKILLIKYQSPIPYGGPLYKQNTVDVNARKNYYRVFKAPYGRIDGRESPDGGSPRYLSQEHIDAAAAVVAPFNLSINYDLAADSIVMNIHIKAVHAFSGTSLKLHVALLETLQFPTPPGANGETIFHNVMRKLYPGPEGLSLNNVWVSGQSQNITISGIVPKYVNQNGAIFIAVWIQDDSNKQVLQTARFPQHASHINNTDSNQTIQFVLFPNPVQDELYIELDAPRYEIINCFITDIFGRVEKKLSDQRLILGRNVIKMALEDLAPGFYLMNIAMENEIFKRKFIKE